MAAKSKLPDESLQRDETPEHRRTSTVTHYQENNMAQFVTKELRSALRATYGPGGYRITANGEIHYKRQVPGNRMNPRYYWAFLCRLSDYRMA